MVGIDAKNKNVIDTKFLCPNCVLIIQEPIQLIGCGHHLCQSCFDSQLTSIKNSARTVIKCSKCLIETQKDQVMVDHTFKRNMESLPIECSRCDWIGILDNYQIHLNHDHRNPKCKNCDQQFDSIQNLNEHQVFQCQKMITDCLLKEFGCDEQIVCCDILDHYSSEQHQSSLLKTIYQMQLPIQNTNIFLTQIENNLFQSSTVVAVNPSTIPFRELYDTLHILFDDIKIFSNDEQQHLDNALLQCQKIFPTLTIEFLQTNLSVQESNEFVGEAIANQNTTENNVISSEETSDDLPYNSHDGIFIWKITGFRKKMNDAQLGRQPAIDSPPFCSSPTGYKIRARLYLHGDGNARRTHMSLFFVLMQGLNDSILKFPFNYKVIFCLYDQSDAKEHIIDSFRPDIRSNSFQRPQSDMNIASGIPKFSPLTMIEQAGNSYVRNDTMFIKIMVDFNNIPKALLHYAVSLSPAMPTHTQLVMIKREAEKRAQQQF